MRALKGALKLEEIFAAALHEYLGKIDPDRRAKRIEERAARRAMTQTPVATQAPEFKRSRYIRAADRREVRTRSGEQCEWVDPKSGRRCEGRTRLQYDHRVPFARGGGSGAANLRMLCPSHNAFAAIQAFGLVKMERYLGRR